MARSGPSARWGGVGVSALILALFLSLLALRGNAGLAASGYAPLRLPFAGRTYISNGPNCATHSGASAQAIDFPLEEGTAVLAAQSGVVIWADRDAAQPSLGKILKIRHGDGSVAWYTHLQDFSASVGAEVANGERVAFSGKSGGSGGSGEFDAHLHFELRDQAGAPMNITALPGLTWFSRDYCGTGNAPAGVAFGAPPSSGDRTLLWFELLVPGIGRHGTRHPLESERTKNVRVKLFGFNNTQHTMQTTATYESESGSYIGVIDLGQDWPTGVYSIVLRLPNTLGERFGILPTVMNGATTVLPKLVLEPGDANDDNILHAYYDFKVLMGCYSVHRPAENCATAADRGGSDINDDGRVDYEDHDIFITMVSVLEGD